MLLDLKFVMGAVSKKDFIPQLTHFVISKGVVRGFNGTIALGSPIACELECKPKAEPLVRAIGHCEETVQLTLTGAGRLKVASGKFKAFIDCAEGESPHLHPEGEDYDMDGEYLLKACEILSPFIGGDASRPWSNGIMFRGQSAFATNNITLVEYWIGKPFPRELVIPKSCVKELLRIGEAPIRVQANQHSLTFHFTGDRWLRTLLLDANSWPDINRVLNRPNAATLIDVTLFPALVKIKSFVDKLGRIYFANSGVTTSMDDNQSANVEIPGWSHDGVYNVDMLCLLEGVATSIDWGGYPGPCMFFGERLRGAIVGMKK